MVKKRTGRLSFLMAAVMLLSLFAAVPGIAFAADIAAAPVTGVTSPEGGATPSTAITAGTGFTAALSWNGNPAVFAYDTIYTATVTLTAAETYDFDGLDNTESIAGFTVNGHAPVWVSRTDTELVFTVDFPKTDAAPVPEITGVTAGTDTIAAGGDSVITVAGTNLPADITVKAFLGDSATADTSVTAGVVGGSATSRTVTLTFPENESAADKVYTVKVSLDGGTNYNATYTDTVTVSASAPPVLIGISAYPSQISSGGTTSITVTGTDLPDTILVKAFLGNSATADAGVTAGAVGGTATSRTVTLTFPENNSMTTLVYTIKVSLDGGANYINETYPTTVSVFAAPFSSTPEITRITANPATISALGGNCVITVEGRNLPDGITVRLSNANGIFTGETEGDTGYQQAGFSFPPNPSRTAQRFSVEARLDNGSSATAEITVLGVELAIPCPVTGIEAPSAYGIPDGTGNETLSYSVSVLWPEVPMSGRFLPETTYGAYVTLTPKPGYTFEGGFEENPQFFDQLTVNGVAPEEVFLNEDHSISFYVTPFPATEAAPALAMITPEQIDGVFSPVEGALPSGSIRSGTNYTAKIMEWYVTENLTSSVIDKTVPFEYGKTYAIAVGLTANPGYAFWDVSKDLVFSDPDDNDLGVDPALVAEAQAIIESFTVNGIKPSRIDTDTWFILSPYEAYFYIVFPAAPAATVPANEGNAQIGYTLSGGNNVSLNISYAKISELIAGAKAADNVVDISLTGVGGGIQSADIPVIALAVFANQGLSLSVGFPAGAITIDGTALKSFVDAAAASVFGSENFKVILRSVPSGELNTAQAAAVAAGESVYQIAMLYNAGEIHEFSGSFSITVPYGEKTPSAAWYLKDDGTKEAVSFSLNTIAKTVTVTLPHLSLYGLSFEAVSATPVPTANQNGVPVTGDPNNAMLWIMLMLVSVGVPAGMFVWHKKNSEDDR